MDGIIPVAGEGRRLGLEIPKHLLTIGDKTLLERNLDLMKRMGVRKAYVVFRTMNSLRLTEEYCKNIPLSVELIYLLSPNTEGIADTVYTAKAYIDNTFAFILGDEFYQGSNHKDMAEYFRATNPDGLIGVFDRPELQLTGYSVKYTGKRVLATFEKPKTADKNMLSGCGSYIFNPTIFEYIEKTPISSVRGEMEITDSINLMAKEKDVRVWLMSGDFVNINTSKDLDHARSIYRKNV